MIVQNEQYPFGTRITKLETSSFNCMVSTAKEGVLKPLSTVIIEDYKGNQRPCAKVIWAPIMRKSDIQQAHEVLVIEINKLGETGISLGRALEIMFDLFKERGAISEALNFAS